MRVRFSSPARESRYWWTMRGCDERYLVYVRERLALPDGLVAYTVVDRPGGVRGRVVEERSGIPGACREADIPLLLARARARGLVHAMPLHVAECRRGDGPALPVDGGRVWAR